jgi:outer membrane protein, multidrug efflux system
VLPPAVPGGLPSTLLERRPDILQAEQELISANANIGVAQSLYFPDLSLTGLLGSTSAALGDFLTSGSLAWAVTAGWPARSSPSARSKARCKAPRHGSARRWPSTSSIVLVAFRETNDALTGTVKKRDEAAAQMRRVASLREFARLSRCASTTAMPTT